MLSSKNIIKTALLSVIAAVLMPFFAHAASYEVSNPLFLSGYLSTGGEITLTDNISVTVNNMFVLEDSVIDLNGHTLNLNNNVLVSQAKLTIKDSSTNQTGKITCGGDNYCIQVGGSNNRGELYFESGTVETTTSEYAAIYNLGYMEMTGGTVRTNEVGVYTAGNEIDDFDSTFIMRDGLIQTLDSGTAVVVKNGGSKHFEMYGGKIDSTSFVSANNGAAGVGIYEGATAHFYNGEIESFTFAIFTNGSSSDGAEITIDDGTYKINHPKAPAIYIPHRYGKTIINGGTFEGPAGIEIRAGDLTINGGTFKGGTDEYEVVLNNSGSTTIGAAVAISQHNTKEPINVTINGGTFEANMPLSFANPQNNSQEDLDKITITVTGGEFMTDQTDVVAVPDTVEAKFITGGIFANSVTENVADGYGEVPLGGTTVEVTPYRNITIEDGSVDRLTLKNNTTRVLYKSTVEYEVVEDPVLRTVVEIIDENGDVTNVSGGSFVMPNSDVLMRVRYVEDFSYKVTFKIVNGTWEDGTTEDITVEIWSDDYGAVVLKEGDYPIGMIVKEGYTSGAWDQMIIGEITKDMTFTYAYVEEEITVPDTHDDEKQDEEQGEKEATEPGKKDGKEEKIEDAEEEDIVIPNTGTGLTDDDMSKTGSLSGIAALAAGLIVIIGALAHVGRNLFIDGEE